MSAISKNIRHLRKLKGLTQEQLADELDISRSRIGSYEEGRSEPPIDLLIGFSDWAQLPLDVLVKNDLSRSTSNSFIEIGNQRVLFPIMVDAKNDDLIEIIPAKASAGYLNGYADPEYISELERIRLPFIPTGKHRGFPIKGDSMLPLKDGSYVIGKYVERLKDIQSGKTYILLTKNDGIVYKRVVRPVNDPDHLLLCSDNKAYESYTVSLSEILEIWEFTCSLNLQEYEEKDLRIDSILKMLRDLQVELKALKQ